LSEPVLKTKFISILSLKKFLTIITVSFLQIGKIKKISRAGKVVYIFVQYTISKNT
jgi:hypothetical protein